MRRLRPGLSILGLAATLLAAGAAAAQGPARARTPDGRPEWNGFWAVPGGLLDRNFGPGFDAAQKSPSGPSRPPATNPLDLMKPPYKARYEALLAREAAGDPAPDPTAVCFPPGMPRMMNMTYGMEVLQTPKVMAITSEWGPATRRIWLDGRGHPPEDELDPTFSGHSIGRWEGDVLVVDTVGLRTDAVLNQSGLMHSDKLRLVERIYEMQPGLLVDEITVIDPEVFTGEWKILRGYGFKPELSLREYVCQDNNRNITPDGKPAF
jgi:hypothetical protein